MTVAMLVLVVSEPYRVKRLTAYTDPWADPYDTGFQLTQSLIAFGRGEWVGVGLGNSIQKLFYLPEAHTDFVFAVLAEEFGFIGVLFVLLAADVRLSEVRDLGVPGLLTVLDLIFILMDHVSDGSAYNIGSGKLTSFLDLIAVFSSIAGYWLMMAAINCLTVQPSSISKSIVFCPEIFLREA